MIVSETKKVTDKYSLVPMIEFKVTMKLSTFEYMITSPDEMIPIVGRQLIEELKSTNKLTIEKTVKWGEE